MQQNSILRHTMAVRFRQTVLMVAFITVPESAGISYYTGEYPLYVFPIQTIAANEHTTQLLSLFYSLIILNVLLLI